ncbi:MAG: type 4a pilus biogenesis protein PilO [Candidatus Aureabacteria bacterium]|nr:type 4a pilus biogenesis protein PilO [Candidatus Auribacterota bacterium]
MNYTQKTLSLIFGIILLLAAFYLVVYLPQSRELARLRGEARSFQTRIEEIHQKKARLPQVMKEIADYEEKIRRLDEQYPRTIDPIYRDIDRVAETTGLKISKMVTSDKPVRDQALTVKENDISVEARGSVRVLGEFLHGIAALPVTLSVSALKISREETQPATDKVSDLKAEIRITAFLSRAGDQPSGKGSKP